MFKLYCGTVLLLRGDGSSSGCPPYPTNANACTYFQVKQGISHYQVAKARLVGEGCIFAGWVTSGVQWENFTTLSLDMEQDRNGGPSKSSGVIK